MKIRIDVDIDDPGYEAVKMQLEAKGESFDVFFDRLISSMLDNIGAPYKVKRTIYNYRIYEKPAEDFKP
jgi:hypothetical protein